MFYHPESAILDSSGSKFRWAVSNLLAFMRWNLFSYRNLWEWLDRPFDTPPEMPQPLQLQLDSILQ